MNIKKILIVVFIALFLTTGCYDRNVDKKTNQSYTTNIMCKPTSKELNDLYSKHKKDMKVDVEKLPECKDFKVTDGDYENLFNSLFVKPLAWLILKLGELVKNYGISIMIIGLLLRVIMIPLTKKSMMQSEMMKKAQPDIKRIEKKYKNKTDKDALMMKSQETMMVYKKYGINPMAGCIFAFLQLPIFFAFLEAIYRVPTFFEEKFWIFDLGKSPSMGIQANEYAYLIIVILIIGTTYFSFKNMNMSTTDDSQAKQMKMMMMFMLVFIAFASFSLPVAIALYWIASSVFSIGQNIYVKKVTIKHLDEIEAKKEEKKETKENKKKTKK